MAHRPDSQDICFVPDGDYVRFLTTRPEPLLPGTSWTGGPRPGAHRGQQAYTIGQRRGLGISAPHPLYVYGKDPVQNTVTLAEDAALYRSALVGREANWIPFDAPAGPIRVTAKTRYSQTEAPATATPLDDGQVLVEFDAPQRAIAPGQTVVFYDGEVVVGGATIHRALP